MDWAAVLLFKWTIWIFKESIQWFLVSAVEIEIVIEIEWKGEHENLNVSLW